MDSFSSFLRPLCLCKCVLMMVKRFDVSKLTFLSLSSNDRLSLQSTPRGFSSHTKQVRMWFCARTSTWHSNIDSVTSSFDIFLCSLVQALTAARLTHVSFEKDEPGMDDPLETCYEFGPLQTSSMLQSMSLNWDICQIKTHYVTKPSLPSTMMRHITKLVFGGQIVWLKEFTDAISQLQLLQKLKICEMQVETDSLLQPFSLLKRWAHTRDFLPTC